MGFLCSVSFMLGAYYSSMYCKKDFMDSPVDALYTNLNDDLNRSLRSQSTFLVVLVISDPKNIERRTAIRQTWLNIQDKDLEKDVLPFFVVGNDNLSDVVAKELDDEISKYKDMVFLPFHDNYNTLTKKVLLSFVHVEKNVKFSFLLKVDDDSFANLASIVNDLKTSNNNVGLYWGFFDGKAPILKTGKWKELDYVLCDR